MKVKFLSVIGVSPVWLDVLTVEFLTNGLPTRQTTAVLFSFLARTFPLELLDDDETVEVFKLC